MPAIADRMHAGWHGPAIETARFGLVALPLPSVGLWRQAALWRAMLGAADASPARWCALHGADAIAGWGHRASGLRAMRLAEHLGKPALLLEDGFLRSVQLGHEAPPLSILADDIGIHYDATRASRLERAIGRPLDDDQAARARNLVAQWRESRVSKYNHARDESLDIPPGFVLVVDQTSGDASIAGGLADARSFARMLEAALDEHPNTDVVLKVHPDVVAGRRRGHFDRLSPAQRARVRLLASSAHPAPLLEHASAVYCVTSQLGFEALMWGRRVRCFGMPFYAGWGLTEDELPSPERRGRASIDGLVHAALVEVAHYLDPETGKACTPERLIDWLGLQRRMRQRFGPVVHAVGFSPWKKPIVRAFLGGSEVRFVGRAAPCPDGGTVAVWGRRDPPAHTAQGARVLRLEDGFLRSVGLGADLVRPLSWVVDDEGLYYDAARPSSLERLLQDGNLAPALQQRARALRERLVQHGITKYNVGAGRWHRPAGAKPVVLVVGQVESDAAVAHGSRRVRSNLALLQAVRRERPDAHLVYKPHPDVLAGLRARGEGEDEALSHCDEVVGALPISVMLGEVDEVHVMTSLAGFEALLRGVPVVTHGQPFYAGWGLTDDRDPPARRTRRRSLDELVAAALILYPTYVSRTSGCFTTPERALDELLEWRRCGAATAPWRTRLTRTLLRLARRDASAAALRGTAARS